MSGKQAKRQRKAMMHAERLQRSQPAEVPNWVDEVPHPAAGGPEIKAPPSPVSDAERAVEPVNLTARQLAAKLNISLRTLQRMDKAGSIPGRITLLGSVRYYWPAVEEWLHRQVEEKPGHVR